MSKTYRAHFCVENTEPNRKLLHEKFRAAMPAHRENSHLPYLFARHVNNKWHDYEVKQVSKPQGPVLNTDALTAIAMLDDIHTRVAFIKSFK